MKKKLGISLLCSIFITASIVTGVFAADGFNSKGSISFAGPDETPSTSDDIIFDSADLDIIYDEISAGKSLLESTIEDKGFTVTKTEDTPTFEELNTAIGEMADASYTQGYTEGSATTGVTITKHYHTTQCYENGYMYTVSCLNCGNGYYSNNQNEAASHTCEYCHEYQVNGFELHTHAIVCGKSQGEVVKVTQGDTVLYQK